MRHIKIILLTTLLLSLTGCAGFHNIFSDNDSGTYHPVDNSSSDGGYVPIYDNSGYHKTAAEKKAERVEKADKRREREAYQLPASVPESN